MVWNPISEAKKAARKTKKAAERAAREAKRTAERAARKAEQAAKDAAKKAERLAAKATDEIKRQVMSIIDDARKLANKAKDEITKVAKDAENKITAAASTAERKITAAGEAIERRATSVLGEIDKAGSAAVSKVEGVADQIPAKVEEAITETLPDLVTKQAPRLAVKVIREGSHGALEFAGELQGALSGPGLRAIRAMVHTAHSKLTSLTAAEPELVEDLDAIGGGVRVGLIKAEFSGYYSRMGIIVGVLDRYIAHPPTFRRREVREFMTALGPTSLAFTGSLKANIVCVGSSVMEIEADVNSIPFRLGIRAVDEVLKAAGVPE